MAKALTNYGKAMKGKPLHVAVLRKMLQNGIWIWISLHYLPSFSLSFRFPLMRFSTFSPSLISLNKSNFVFMNFQWDLMNVSMVKKKYRMLVSEWGRMTHTLEHFLGLLKQYHWISKSYSNQRLYKYSVPNDTALDRERITGSEGEENLKKYRYTHNVCVRIWHYANETPRNEKKLSPSQQHLFQQRREKTRINLILSLYLFSFIHIVTSLLYCLIKNEPSKTRQTTREAK